MTIGLILPEDAEKAKRKQKEAEFVLQTIKTEKRDSRSARYVNKALNIAKMKNSKDKLDRLVAFNEKLKRIERYGTKV